MKTLATVTVTALEATQITVKLQGFKVAHTHTFWGYELTMARVRQLTLADIDNIVSEVIIAEALIDIENCRIDMCKALIEYIYNM